MSNLTSNWVRFEKGLVIDASVHGIPLGILLDMNVTEAESFLDSEGWKRVHSEDWLEASTGNGLLYFKHIRQPAPA